MRFAHTGFRHRHLGAQRGRIVTELTQMPGQRIRYRGKHPDRHRRPGQLGAMPDHRADTSGTRGPRVGAQHRPRVRLRGHQTGFGVTLQLPMGAGGPNTAPGQRGPAKRRWCLHRRYDRGTAEQDRRQRRHPNAVTQRVRGLHDRDRPFARDARHAVDRCENVQPPGHHAGVQLVVGQRADGGKTSRPAVVGEIVHNELARIDSAAHPRRVGQNAAVFDPQRQLRAAPGALADDAQRLLEVGRHTGEPVQQELVVGNLGRHPVRLRVDRRHPAERHAVRG